MCNGAGIFVHQHVPVICNACMSGVMVILFTALNTYDIAIVTYMHYIST